MDATSPPTDLEELLKHTVFLGRLARGLIGNPEDAEDVAQETWLRTIDRRGPPIRQPRGWLRSVARNLVRTKARAAEVSTRHAPRLPRPEPAPSTLDVLVREELRQRVVQAVLALPEPYRRVVLLRYYEGLPVRAVAARVEAPLDTVRTRLRRALERLRAALDEDERDASRGRGWRVALLGLAAREPPEWGPPSFASSLPVGAAALLIMALGLGSILLLLTRGAGELFDGTIPSHPGPSTTTAMASDAVAGPRLGGRSPRSAMRGPAARSRPLAESRTRLAPPVVRDMLDGSLCSNLERISWRVPGESGDAVQLGSTTEDGRWRPAGDPVPLPPRLHSGWYAVGDPVRVRRSGVLWAFRTVQVVAHVEGDDGASPLTGARLKARRIGSRDAARYRPPGLGDSLHQAAVDWIRRPSPAGGAAHVHALLLPRVPGLIVSAAAPGHLAAWTLLELHAEDDRVHVQFRLRPGPVLLGRVLDGRGAPSAGATVLVRVVVPAPRDRAELDQLCVGVGWTCFVAGGERDPHVRFESEGAVDAEGRFRADLPVLGQVLLRAWREGQVAVEQTLGTLAPGPTAVELELGATGPTLPSQAELLLAGGTPQVQADTPLEVMRVEGTAVTRIWTLDAVRPVLPVAELERGVRYVVTLGPPERRRFVGGFEWDGVVPIRVGE